MTKSKVRLCVLLVFLVAGVFQNVFAQEEPISLGKVMLPKDVIMRNNIVPAGKYEFLLAVDWGDDPVLLMAQKDEDTGLTNVKDLKTEITDSNQNFSEPELKIEVVEIEDVEYVRITVHYQNKR